MSSRQIGPLFDIALPCCVRLSRSCVISKHDLEQKRM